ncbi:26649_t:CDS:2 [Gigaspora margarita]|uniref:26649_t:CDS:1 n=1 Tax=Gigaspora margarita TaxID=4874 RepID=A0ABN7V923_GIGMA|nr:26649_t:CDS:2 [Gigaspora margarita]
MFCKNTETIVEKSDQDGSDDLYESDNLHKPNDLYESDDLE